VAKPRSKEKKNVDLEFDIASTIREILGTGT
jgi:hypothetical protein